MRASGASAGDSETVTCLPRGGRSGWITSDRGSLSVTNTGSSHNVYYCQCQWQGKVASVGGNASLRGLLRCKTEIAYVTSHCGRHLHYLVRLQLWMRPLTMNFKLKRDSESESAG